MSVHAVVVTYNSASHIRGLAASISASSVDSVALVDNGSVDESMSVARAQEWNATYTDISLVNPGFGAGCNAGARATPKDDALILVVNPDVTFDPLALDEAILTLHSRPNIAAVGVRLTRPSGEPVSSARRFPSPRSIMRRRPDEMLPAQGSMPVDWICGAFMLWRPEAFRAVGGFSEEYFLYFEDVDICRKARRAGWDVVANADITVFHDQGHGEATSRRLRQESAKSRRIYAHRWLGIRGVVACRVAELLELGAALVHAARRRDADSI